MNRARRTGGARATTAADLAARRAAWEAAAMAEGIVPLAPLAAATQAPRGAEALSRTDTAPQGSIVDPGAFSNGEGILATKRG